MSTLPVRSPLPNSVPSTRSAPAITASSAAATAVPRSLCGCTDSTMRVALRDVAAEPFDLVGVDVRRRHLDRRRQVEDHLALGRRLPDLVHRVADLDREVELGAGEALRAVLEQPVRAGLRCGDARARSARPAPRCRRCRPGRARTRRAAAPWRSSCRGARSRARAPRSDSNVRSISSGRACVSTWIVTSSGIRLLLDQLAHEVEVGLRRRREADLDLLEAGAAPAGRTCGACARRPSARSAPGCRRAGRRCTTAAALVITLSGQVRAPLVDRRERAVLVWSDPATSCRFLCEAAAARAGRSDGRGRTYELRLFVRQSLAAIGRMFAS